MSDYDVFPDVVAIVRKGLADALSCGVYSSIPKTPTYPLATVRRSGGSSVERHRLDEAFIDIDVWGNSQSEAQDIAQNARVAVHRMEGQSFTDPVSGVVSGVADLGFVFFQDPLTARDHFVVSLAVYAHA